MQRVFSIILGLGVLALTACKPEPGIQTYTTPKEATAPRPAVAGAPGSGATPPPMSGPMSGGTPPMANGSGGAPMVASAGMAAQVSGFTAPAWQAPDAWQAKELGSVRKGSWGVTDADGSADISVTVFPGDVGGDLANVNRWRQQVQLPPLTADQLNGAMQHVDTAGGHAHVVYLVGSSGQAIHGAILPKDGATWFIKMQGDAATVESQREAFSGFLQTVDFDAQTNQ